MKPWKVLMTQRLRIDYQYGIRPQKTILIMASGGPNSIVVYIYIYVCVYIYIYT